MTIICGFAGLFVNADDCATIPHPILDSFRSSHLRIIPDLLDQTLDFCTEGNGYEYCTVIQRYIMAACTRADRGVARSSNSSTVYMAALQTLQLPNAMNAPFILMEGQLIFNGRYHRSLLAVRSRRPGAEKNIHQDTQPIIPSSIGEHSSLEMTILESVRCFELASTIRIGGEIVYLDLEQVILASWEVRETEPCDHPADTPLEPRYNDAVLTTSVASPSAINGKIAIVQVSRNPVAQLLACVPMRRSLLQANCCLNCAYEEAKKCEYAMIIVG